MPWNRGTRYPGFHASGKEVSEYIVVNGVTYRLLLGRDNLPVIGRDGQFLYGRA